MAWTLADIRDRARALSGRQSASRLSDAAVDSHINNFYRNHLPERLSPTELQGFSTLTTSAGTGEYSESTLSPSIRAIWPPVFVDGDRATFSHDPAWFFVQYPDRDAQPQQQPEAVLHFDRQLWLAPVPDDAYEIKVTALKRPDALSNDGDTPVDERWGESVAIGAAILILRNVGDHEEARALDPFLAYHLGLIEKGNILNFQGMRPAPQF